MTFAIARAIFYTVFMLFKFCQAKNLMRIISKNANYMLYVVFGFFFISFFAYKLNTLCSSHKYFI